MEQSQAGDFVDRPSEIGHDASVLASCFWCEGLHQAEHPLSVCPTCVGTYRAKRYPMGSLEMDGSYPLDDEAIDERVSRTSPGYYALGYMDGPGGVGSRRRGYLPQGAAPALDRVGIGVDSSYTRFAYSYAASAEAAFEKECRNYHDFGASHALDNQVHPVPTSGSSGDCLVHEQ